MSAHSTSSFAALLAVVALAGLSTVALAQTQQPRRTAAQPTGKSSVGRANPKTADRQVRPVAGEVRENSRTARPAAEQLRIVPLPPELEDILIQWEQTSAKIERIVGEHQRIVYNKVFEVEKWADGKFYYESPDKGRIDLKGIEPKENDVSQRTNKKTGEPYRIEPDQETRWICTGEEIININDSSKEFEMFPLPQELQGQNIIHGPLPFLFGMKAEEAKRRFEISFFDQNDPGKNNKKVVWLKAKPRQGADKENFREATIILDRTRYLPLAVRLIDPSGNLETVYKFPPDNLHVNKRELVPPIFRNDPFHPSLRGYKMIQQQVAVPKDGQSRAQDGSPPNVRQASGSAPLPRSRTANAGGTRPPVPRSRN